MNVEIGAEAALFPEKEYINGIFVTVCRRKCWPGTETPGDRHALEEHEEKEGHSARRVLVKQLEHVDSALKQTEQNVDSVGCSPRELNTSLKVVFTFALCMLP